MGRTVLTPGLVGGILLIIGAYLTFKGKMYHAVFVYFMADCAWLLLSFLSGDIIGAVTVFIGMALGLGAFIKMNTGKMRKELKW